MTDIVLPAEYEKHYATIMIWPRRPGSWPYGGKEAKPVFAEMVRAISHSEKVYLCLFKEDISEVSSLLEIELNLGYVTLIPIPTDDCWARDISPIFVRTCGYIEGQIFSFNAWGREGGGLYKDYMQDDAFAETLCKKLNIRTDENRFVLEGGSICSNGKGTIITTEECLLNIGRNPGCTKEQIENILKTALGAKKIIWLPYGLLGDETSGHVDNVCAFVGERKALLAWTDEGEGGERCRKNLKVLEKEGIDVIKMPLPNAPVTISKKDLDGLTFAEGEDKREEGEILAASYINFYVYNEAVLCPKFGDINDPIAADVLRHCFTDREVIQIDAKPLIVGGGNIHCLTMQIPQK